MMTLLRLAFLIGLVIFGASGLLLGGVTGLSALRTGAIEMSYVSDGRQVVQKASQADDPAVFWRYVTLLSAVPMVLGAGALFVGLRGFRSRGGA